MTEWVLGTIGIVVALLIPVLGWVGKSVIAHERKIGILNERTKTQSEMLKNMDEKLDELLRRK